MSFSFTVKPKKKNPFQRQKELEEEKKKRDEEEAAKVYADFVKDFGSDDRPRAFVRGGVIEPGKPGSSALPPGQGQQYVPPGLELKPKESSKRQLKDDDEDEPVVLLPTSRGKVRKMDLLLADLKKGQAEREARKEQGLPIPQEEEVGHQDSGDPTTTNVFIGNLAPDVDERVLMLEFGRFGPIGSVKVMWPRDEEQHRRGRNTGFVAFMRREDADRAREALDGVMLHDMQIMTGWGKAVPLPAAPCWPPPGGLAAGHEGAAASAPSNLALASSMGAGALGDVGAFDGTAAPGAQDGNAPSVGPDIIVVIPSDPRLRFVIDAVAYYVLRDGCEFEQVVMEREVSNPEFAFLFDVGSPEHIYYRWRLYSLAWGDSLRSWRAEPFQMLEGSERWMPPPMTAGRAAAAATAAARGAGSRHEDRSMSDMQRDKFEDILRSLTAERKAVCAAMAFALDNAECAAEVCEILVDSLTLAETPVPLKVARLFLLSDILHNTSAQVRNASRYRSRLQEALPDVFEGLHEACKASESRMGQELLRRQTLRVLRAWRRWFVFSDDYLNGLQATFLRSASEAVAPLEESGNEKIAALRTELEALGDEELELKCRHSGLSRRGGREMQVVRLLALEVYLSGEMPKEPRGAAVAGPVAGEGEQEKGDGGNGNAAMGNTSGGASGWSEVVT